MLISLAQSYTSLLIGAIWALARSKFISVTMTFDVWGTTRGSSHEEISLHFSSLGLTKVGTRGITVKWKRVEILDYLGSLSSRGHKVPSILFSSVRKYETTSLLNLSRKSGQNIKLKYIITHKLKSLIAPYYTLIHLFAPCYYLVTLHSIMTT